VGWNEEEGPGGDGDLLFEGVEGGDGAIGFLLEDDAFCYEGVLEVTGAADGGLFGEGDGEVFAADGTDDAPFVMDAGIAEIGADQDGI